MGSFGNLLLCGAAMNMFALATPMSAASAQALDQQSYDLPAQSLAASLRAVAEASGRSIVAPANLVGGKVAPALSGRCTVAEAVARLLDGSGLHAVPVGRGLIIERNTDAGENTANETGRNDIVVTGTSIRGARPAGSELITINRREIDQSGYATTEQLLQALPQNFGGGPNAISTGISQRDGVANNIAGGNSINLRGLGADSTLVLVDGNRLAMGGVGGYFTDLSLIPSSAIERIEILPDGASALYGSDAVAGVVNVRLRDDLKGAETRLRYGFADGMDQVQASQLAGFRWHNGHLAIGYEYFGSSRLPAADRSYATEDLTPFGGPDYRKNYANPGTLIDAKGVSYAIPAGQDGSDLTPADLVPGTQNVHDARANTDLLPSVHRHTAYLAGEQKITSALTWHLESLWADRRTSGRALPTFSGTVVTSSNPFYVDPTGTGAPVIVDYDFSRDLGAQVNTAHVRAFNIASSLTADMGPWQIEAYGGYGTQSEHLAERNLPNFARLATALADPDPTSAYNVFGDGSFTNPDTIAAIRGSMIVDGRYRLWSGGLKADGPLFELPAGTVRLALGADYRHDHYAYSGVEDQYYDQPKAFGLAGFPIGRSVIAGFGELAVPLISPDLSIPGVRRLTLSLAGRIEHYSDIGTTANPRAGIDWSPGAGLALRGTIGTSFRAPSFDNLRTGTGASAYAPLPVADPTSSTGKTNALFLLGNNPDIGPEKARTWTIGADFHPSELPGLSATFTYYDVHYRDRIEPPGGAYLQFLANRAVYAPLITDHPDPSIVASYYDDPSFSNPYNIPASQVAAIVDARTGNLASLTQSGLDFDLGYVTRQGDRSFGVGVSGSYIFHIRQKVTAAASAIDLVSTIGSPTNLRLRGRLTATLGRLELASFVNFANGYFNNAVSPVEEVDNFTTVDVHAGFTPDFRGVLAGTRLAIDISNLLDRRPPYVNNATNLSAVGFDPDQASPVGRMVSFQLVKSL